MSKSTVKTSEGFRKTPEDAPNLIEFRKIFKRWPNTKTTPRRKRTVWVDVFNSRIS